MLLSLLFSLLPTVPPTAQPSETADSLGCGLDEVVVTGTRTPRHLADTPVLTRVITTADIQRSDAADIQQLLQQQLPGVEFSYAMNQQTHLNISGFAGQSVLFLVDGVRMAGETMDDIDFSRIALDNVERVEIVRSAASALYGSNATGGVVNIITKQPAKPIAATLSARCTAHSGQRYAATIEARHANLANMLTASYSREDNYDVSSGPDPVTRVVTTIYGNTTFNANDKLTWQPADCLAITATAGFFFRETERTEDIPERYRDLNASLKADWNISARNNLQISYTFDQYDKSDYQRIAALDIRDYSNVQNSLSALYTNTARRGNTLSVGAGIMHDYLFNNKLEGNTRRQDCLHAFAQYDWQPSDIFEAVAALRYDHFSDTGDSRLTPKLSLCLRPTAHLSLRAGYGMGFRAPSLKERYYNFDMSGIWIMEGNPALKPERSHNLNLSAEYVRRHCSLSVSTYYNKVRDKIATAPPYYKDPSDILPYLPYTNIPRYEVWGGEATAEGRWSSGISTRFSYAYTHEGRQRDDNGNALPAPYIPARPHSLNIQIGYDRRLSRHYALDATLSGRILSATENTEYRNYYDITAGTVTVSYPAYTIWRLSLHHQLWSRVTLTTAIDNLFDYRPAYYYLNAPLTDGITLMIAAKIKL